MLSATEAMQRADEANRPYDLDYIEDFIREAAERGSYQASFQAGRVTSGLEAVLIQSGYRCWREGSAFFVSWSKLESEAA